MECHPAPARWSADEISTVGIEVETKEPYDRQLLGSMRVADVVTRALHRPGSLPPGRRERANRRITRGGRIGGAATGWVAVDIAA